MSNLENKQHLVELSESALLTFFANASGVTKEGTVSIDDQDRVATLCELLGQNGVIVSKMSPKQLLEQLGDVRMRVWPLFKINMDGFEVRRSNEIDRLVIELSNRGPEKHQVTPVCNFDAEEGAHV